MSYAEKNLAPGEQILYRASYHWIIYRAAMILLGLAFLLGLAAFSASRTAPSAGVGRVAGLVALAFVALSLFAYLLRRARAAADEFVVTNHRVIRRVGLLSRQIQQAPLDRIQDITVDQGVVGRFLDYGDIILETASERGRLVFPDIADPEAFRNHLWGQGLASANRREPEAAPGAPGSSEAERLANLEELRRRGLVTAEEYHAKRKEIVDRL